MRFSERIGFRLCGIADEPFWPAVNGSSASRTSVRCRWRTSVACCSSVAPGERERGEELGVAVAVHDLRRRALAAGEAQPLHHERLDPRVDVRERADRAGDLPDGDRPAGARERLAPPRPGVVPAGELQAEGDRLGVDAVAAPHHRRAPVLERALLHRRQHAVHARRGGARSPPASWTASVVSSTSEEVIPLCRWRAAGAALLLDEGEEGDDVVLHRPLDLVDARDVGRGELE